MALAESRRSSRGFSLVEVLFAMAILTTIALGVAQTFAVATRANADAKGQTSTAILATQKMEQLRGLTWGLDTAGLGLPLSDTVTDLSVDPPTDRGTGLNPSPGGTLQSNIPPFVDYLDQYGNWVGNQSNPPPTAVYIRRWSIEPLPTNPNNTLIFQVMVTRVVTESIRLSGGVASSDRWRLRDDAWVVTARTRKSK